MKKLNIDSKLLLVIDVQKDFINNNTIVVKTTIVF